MKLLSCLASFFRTEKFDPTENQKTFWESSNISLIKLDGYQLPHKLSMTYQIILSMLHSKYAVNI